MTQNDTYGIALLFPIHLLQTRRYSTLAIKSGCERRKRNTEEMIYKRFNAGQLRDPALNVLHKIEEENIKNCLEAERQFLN